MAGSGRKILAEGIESRYDSLPVRELSLVTLVMTQPDPDDAHHRQARRPGAAGLDAVQLHRPCAGGRRGERDSYATRLFDYDRTGRDQVAWVIDRLGQDRSSRSAAITTFQPQTDSTYIPCVSLLDFWLPGGAVELVADCHSIDFGAKGYGNLVELAALQGLVAGELGRPAGGLIMVVKSAHVMPPSPTILRIKSWPHRRRRFIAADLPS